MAPVMMGIFLNLWAYMRVRWVGLCVALLALGADVVTKRDVLDAAARGLLPWHPVPGWLDVVLAWNRGMSFSLMSGNVTAPWVLGGIAVGACAWFFHWLGKMEPGSTRALHVLGLGLLMGGAMGNLIDRLTHGAVVDMLAVRLFGWQVPFVFNVADAAISVGVACLLWDAVGQEVWRVVQLWRRRAEAHVRAQVARVADMTLLKKENKNA